MHIEREPHTLAQNEPSPDTPLSTGALIWADKPARMGVEVIISLPAVLALLLLSIFP